MVTCRKKSTDDPREESITEDPEEEPITGDSRRTLSLRTLKRTLLLRTLRGFSGSSGPSMTLASQKTLFFLVMVYDRVGDGDKHSYETFGLGIPRFHATSHLKIEGKEFFM